MLQKLCREVVKLRLILFYLLQIYFWENIKIFPTSFSKKTVHNKHKFWKNSTTLKIKKFKCVFHVNNDLFPRVFLPLFSILLRRSEWREQILLIMRLAILCGRSILASTASSGTINRQNSTICETKVSGTFVFEFSSLTIVLSSFERAIN